MVVTEFYLTHFIYSGNIKMFFEGFSEFIKGNSQEQYCTLIEEALVCIPYTEEELIALYKQYLQENNTKDLISADVFNKEYKALMENFV